MKEAAKLLEFEHAAFLRDQIDRLRRGENPTVDSAAETVDLIPQEGCVLKFQQLRSLLHLRCV